LNFQTVQLVLSDYVHRLTPQKTLPRCRCTHQDCYEGLGQQEHEQQEQEQPPAAADSPTAAAIHLLACVCASGLTNPAEQVPDCSNHDR